MRIFTTILFLVIGVVSFAQRDFPYLDSSAFSYLESNNYEAAERAAGEILEITNKDGASTGKCIDRPGTILCGKHHHLNPIVLGA